MSYLDNIFNFVDYEYLNPSRNTYGNIVQRGLVSTQVITREELKSHLRITNSSEDTLLDTYILAATQMAEHYCNRHFINAKYQISFNDLPDTFSLYYPDVTLVLSQSTPDVTIDDGLFYNIETLPNTYISMGTSNYYIKDSNPYIFSKTSRYLNPSGLRSMDEMDASEDSRWKFNFTTGMGAAASAIPDAIKQAIKLIAGDMYYFREDRKRQFPMASEILLQPYKCYL